MKEKSNNKNILDEMTKFMDDLIDFNLDFRSNYYYMEEARDFYINMSKQKKLKF